MSRQPGPRRDNLTLVQDKAGDPARAVPLDSAVAQSARVLGDARPDTSAARHNLAAARRKARAAQQPGTAAPAAASTRHRSADPA
ncbi:hypothetical protein [Streptomyces shenzhenensis]|uniref:hypothetical protein n=1 Tax=Streptomyces shenzhenensis TaxID=943815 RepID=UPI0033ECA215